MKGKFQQVYKEHNTRGYIMLYYEITIVIIVYQ